ncbi:MAG: helix-turn-helix domain-containing protein [Actinobacteria bacterium]|nr:helix-turn-helix domain-containing protein [Actinomycetota bacterium]
MPTDARQRAAGEPTALVRDLAANLRRFRGEAGLEEEELAEAAEIGVEFLIELEEAGGAMPAIGVVLRLAGALGRRPSELVAGVEWVPFQLKKGKGRFEVVEDIELVAEIASLKETFPTRTGRRGAAKPDQAGGPG